MATSGTVMLSSALVILAAMLGCNGEVAVNATKDCVEQQHQQEIDEVVNEFNTTRNWARLRRNLTPELNQTSEAYKQLQSVRYEESWPLYEIGLHNLAELASVLLCAGMSPNTPDITGYAILHSAAAGGHLDLVKTLLSHGADVDLQTNSGKTPLMKAARWGYLEVAKALVEAGANTSLADSNGATALEFADRSEMLEYLKNYPH